MYLFVVIEWFPDDIQKTSVTEAFSQSLQVYYTREAAEKWAENRKDTYKHIKGYKTFIGSLFFEGKFF